MAKRKSSKPRTSSRGRAAPKGAVHQSGERLQKILASAGVASRRDCEQLILDGRVMVDGEIVTKLGSRADLATQEIAVDGQKLKRPKHIYYAVHKPKGVVSTNWDPSGRMRLIDLAPDDKRLFCVGRLDRSSEGLAMLTNDGDLAHHIMHPKFGVPKTYIVEVAGAVTSKDIDDLQKGVYLSEGRAKTSTVRVKSRRSKSTLLEIELQEGKNREIRRIMAKLDHKVLNLKRIAIGPLRLGDMPAGAYRELTSAELSGLRKASAEAAPRGGTKRKRPTGGKKKADNADFSNLEIDESLLAFDPDYDDDEFDAETFSDDSFAQDDLGDDAIEVRDYTPSTGTRGGAVIGGDHRGKKSPGKGAKKQARSKEDREFGSREGATRGGKGKSRSGPAAKRSSGGKGFAGKASRGKPAKGKGAGRSGRSGKPKRGGGR